MRLQTNGWIFFYGKKDRKELQNEDELGWSLKEELLNHVDDKDMKEILKANDVPTDSAGNDLQTPLLVQYVADGLLNGLPADCPACGNSTLTLHCGRMVCGGWMSGYSLCKYRGPAKDSARYKFEIPKKIQGKLTWLDNWITKNNGPLSGQNESKENEEKEEEKEEEEEEEEEEETKGNSKKRKKAPAKKTKAKKKAKTTTKKTKGGDKKGGGKVPIRHTLPDKPKSEKKTDII